ncbi:MAG TPA: DUF3467 domain-containing protein [Candidatus Saccharimonadales bacterium]|nr:DUF3467 domain-containing protein [Candidatus Saccharimonadales bacterium]
MSDDVSGKGQKKVNFNINTDKVPVLYADGYLIGSNENVVTLNFSQAMPGTDQQNVVSRIALTRAQAKEFVGNLTDHIDKYEV